MYGWIKLDFRRLGVAVPSNVLVKNSDHPGVRVSIDERGTTLWIGSGANYKPTTRDGRAIIRLDGSGIVLDIEQFEARGFSGSWGGAGIVDAGSGSFRSAL